MDKYIYTVSELTTLIKNLLRQEEVLQNIAISGEISNFHRHSSGHCYFTLKDNKATVQGVLFRSNSQKVKFDLKNGQKVVARGYIDLYEQRGSYQLYVQSIEPVGLGALYLAYEQLKAKLEQQGLFAKEHKLKVPQLPKRIGICTSPTGAAVKDILSVLERRYQGLEVFIAPTAVQGEDAGSEIAAAVQLLDSFGVDVIIVTRGGGAFEELWPFNDEGLARVIYNCQTPIISAVGHERDFTIADFVSDLRAATPSAAAEMVIKARKDLTKEVASLTYRLAKSSESLVMAKKYQLQRLERSATLQRPYHLVERLKQLIDEKEYRLENFVKNYFRIEQEKLNNKIVRLEAISPLRILAKGYAVCLAEKTEKAVTDSADLTVGDYVNLKFFKGFARGKIEAIGEK